MNLVSNFHIMVIRPTRHLVRMMITGIGGRGYVNRGSFQRAEHVFLFLNTKLHEGGGGFAEISSLRKKFENVYFSTQLVIDLT